MLIAATTFTFKIFVSTVHAVQTVGQVLGYVISRSMAATKVKINFNTKHLRKGDPAPSFNGKPRLYNMRYCPYAQRAMLAVLAKNIDVDVSNVDLVDKPEWLVSKSTLGKVPALEVEDGLTIYESLVVVEYLDDAYPQTPLLPKDPAKKALDKVLVEAGTPMISGPLFKFVMAPDSVTDDVIAEFHKGLDLLQNHLIQQGTTFLYGSEPGYADYMIWPFLERLAILDDKRAQIDGTKYNILTAWINNMWQDPVVKEYAVPTEIMKSFFEAYSQKKKPDYDRLLVQ